MQLSDTAILMGLASLSFSPLKSKWNGSVSFFLSLFLFAHLTGNAQGCHALILAINYGCRGC
jgi:hypothetical protein